MVALGFLNPLLLWALPMAAVPIIIHLLNRRRFHKIPWAAMEYLLAAMKRNRRRLRMEHWILLALRTLAVLLLVFLVTRPQLAGGGLIAARTHHVVVLDDSASMAQRGGVVSVYESAEERVQQLAKALAEVDEGDLLTNIELLANTHIPELEYPDFKLSEPPRKVREERQAKQRDLERMRSVSRFDSPPPPVAVEKIDESKFPGGLVPTKMPPKRMGGKVNTARAQKALMAEKKAKDEN